MKISSFFKKKTVSFILQFILLMLIIFLSNYSFQIDFKPDTILEQRIIIQFLANFVLFRGVSGTIFMYLTWLIVSLIPILINFNFKKAYSSNLLSFFILNFFVYVFLFNKNMRVTSDFFTVNFIPLIVNSILLGLTITLYSIFLSILLNKIKSARLEKKVSEKVIDENPLIICPKCGTEFDSIPLYCYNCNSKLTSDEIDNIE